MARSGIEFVVVLACDKSIAPGANQLAGHEHNALGDRDVPLASDRDATNAMPPHRAVSPETGIVRAPASRVQLIRRVDWAALPVYMRSSASSMRL